MHKQPMIIQLPIPLKRLPTLLILTMNQSPLLLLLLLLCVFHSHRGVSCFHEFDLVAQLGYLWWGVIDRMVPSFIRWECHCVRRWGWWSSNLLWIIVSVVVMGANPLTCSTRNAPNATLIPYISPHYLLCCYCRCYYHSPYSPYPMISSVCLFPILLSNSNALFY